MPAVSNHAKGHEPRSGDRCIAWGVSPRYRDEKDEKPLKGATEACLHQVQGTATGTEIGDSSQHPGQQSGTAVRFSDGGMITSGSFGWGNSRWEI